MNNDAKLISKFEGIGTASLVGLFFTGLNSVSLYLNYRSFINTKVVPIIDIDNYLNQKIHVEGEVYSSEKSILYSDSEYKPAYFNTGDKKITLSSGCFYLDPEHKIRVTPELDTKWVDIKIEKPKKSLLTDIVIALLATPLAIFRYFSGLLLSFGASGKSQKTDLSAFIFISGVPINSNEIVPSFISSSRHSVEVSLRDRFKRSLVFPFVFFSIFFASFCMVKWIEKKNTKKIAAAHNMKCVMCKEECNVMFSECFHLCLCEECEKKCLRCPVCGTRKTEIIKVYS